MRLPRLAPYALILFATLAFAQDVVHYLPHYTTTPGKWETRLVLSNAAGTEATVVLEAYSVDGDLLATTERVLGPQRGLDAMVADLFENLTAERGWLSLRASSEAVSGLMTFRDVTTDGVSSLPLMRQIGSDLVLPMLENTQARQSGFVVTNTSDQATEAVFTLTSMDGTWKRTITQQLEAHAKLVSMAGLFFGEDIPQTSRLAIHAEAPIAGFALTFANGTDQIIAVPGSYWDAGQQPSLAKNLAREQNKLNRAGVGAGFHYQGEAMVAAAEGLAHVAENQAMQCDSIADVGSITKTFTSAVILMLQEEGRLSVEDSLSQYFPDFPRSDEVTLRMCLTHTSGIFNYTESQAFLNAWLVRHETFTPEELIDYAAQRNYNFDPGTDWLYSNTNFILLGRIIEMVTGEPYHQQVRNRIFEPLDMRNTYVAGAEPVPNRAGRYLYDPEQEVLMDVTDWNMTWAWSTGAIASTPEDLMKWYDALFGGRVLSEASLEMMTTPSMATGAGASYGMGMAILTLNGKPAFGHDGATEGGIALSFYFPEEEASWIMVINHRSNDLNLEPLILSGLRASGLLQPGKRLNISGLQEVALEF